MTQLAIRAARPNLIISGALAEGSSLLSYFIAKRYDTYYQIRNYYPVCCRLVYRRCYRILSRVYQQQKNSCDILESYLKLIITSINAYHHHYNEPILTTGRLGFTFTEETGLLFVAIDTFVLLMTSIYLQKVDFAVRC